MAGGFVVAVEVVEAGRAVDEVAAGEGGRAVDDGLIPPWAQPATTHPTTRAAARFLMGAPIRVSDYCR